MDDAYLAGEYDGYQNSLRSFHFVSQPAMNPWPPQQNPQYSHLDGTMDDPSHLHHHEHATTSSSSSLPHPSQPIPALANPQTHYPQHHLPHSRSMMSESAWPYASNTPTQPPLHQTHQPHHHQQHQPPQQLMSSNPMLTQPQYSAHFMSQNPSQQSQPVPQHSQPPPQQSFMQSAGLDYRMAQQQQHQQQQQAALNQQYAMATTQEPARQYMPYTSPMEYGPLHVYQHDLQHGLSSYPIDHQQHLRHEQSYGNSPPFGQAGTLLGTSPDSTNFDIQSSSGSESGWQMVDVASQGRSSFESSYDMSPQQPASVSNPGVNLHLRTASDATNPDNLGSASSTRSFGSYEDVPFPTGSPNSENSLELAVVPAHTHAQTMHLSHSEHTTPPAPASSPSSSSSPTSPTVSSPNQRRKKEPAVKTTVTTLAKVKKPATQTKKTGEKEKRVGRRKGPLRPEQRAQAGEIRKLRACLRCKFLKKTCDKGDPCAGCQPAHARLWQVPCTRIDIKEIGYFVKDWTADYQRHVSVGFSIANIRGYSPIERPLFITHGFGYVLPISAREVFVRDEDCFHVEWVETNKEKPEEFESPTARLTAGIEGVSMPVLSEYLDKHIASGFEHWIDQHFEGTVFLTEMLKTAYSYWKKTNISIIFKALKLILAYNLTLHVTMVEGLSEEEGMVGKIDDENSKYFGKTLAPVMINFQVKHALAMMWRDLQREVLEELSTLYSSVYNGERLKNWPTIFMLAAILLAVWEEIQFDSHYRMPDEHTVNKFCNEMESTPVGVIVGLFSAISQKLPAFQEWDTEKHQHLLHSNMPICDAMTEVREHVTKYEDYLKARADSKFDRSNFDSLSNKFLSKLVIRAN